VRIFEPQTDQWWEEVPEEYKPDYVVDERTIVWFT